MGIGLAATGAAVALWLAKWWRGFLAMASLIVAVPLSLALIWGVKLAAGEAEYQRELRAHRSGQADFGEQPELFAVAEAISRNDEEAIRAAAKSVPDLNAPGRDGKTLLFFAVDESLTRPELIVAVRTLLSLGADPNHTNGSPGSFALSRSVSGSVALLQSILDAGGNPNARDPQGRPIVFCNWDLGYFEDARRARLELLLNRGADINAAFPDEVSYYGGYTLAMYRAGLGRGDVSGYADALYLLERGADPNRRSAEGMTLRQIVEEHGAGFGEDTAGVPSEYRALVEWLNARGAVGAERGVDGS